MSITSTKDEKDLSPEALDLLSINSAKSTYGRYKDRKVRSVMHVDIYTDASFNEIHGLGAYAFIVHIDTSLPVLEEVGETCRKLVTCSGTAELYAALMATYRVKKELKELESITFHSDNHDVVGITRHKKTHSKFRFYNLGELLLDSLSEYILHGEHVKAHSGDKKSLRYEYNKWCDMNARSRLDEIVLLHEYGDTKRENEKLTVDKRPSRINNPFKEIFG